MNIKKSLMKVFRNENRSSTYQDYFNINDPKLNEELFKKFPIYEGCTEHEYESFTLKFNWNIQQWMVK